MPVDPVCGMQVSEETPYKVEIEGETYYFCSRDCAEEFVENTKEYISSRQESMGE